jgi:hypothetical protein
MVFMVVCQAMGLPAEADQGRRPFSDKGYLIYFFPVLKP